MASNDGRSRWHPCETASDAPRGTPHVDRANHVRSPPAAERSRERVPRLGPQLKQHQIGILGRRQGADRVPPNRPRPPPRPRARAPRRSGPVPRTRRARDRARARMGRRSWHPRPGARRGSPRPDGPWRARACSPARPRGAIGLVAPPPRGRRTVPSATGPPRAVGRRSAASRRRRRLRPPRGCSPRARTPHRRSSPSAGRGRCAPRVPRSPDGSACRSAGRTRSRRRRARA